MNKIKCLIVDDEPPAVQLLKKYAEMVDQLEVVSTVNSAIDAFDFLKNKDLDLIFLDIQMPVLNGIDFIKSLKNPPAIIFTTAYREYALDGYELDVIDYLLKPIPFKRFLKAVDKYRNRTKVITKERQSLEQDKYIYCNINRTQHKVILSEILYIESLKDYVRLHTSKGRLVVKGNIGSFMKQLPSSQFVRIHRSFAVAVEKINSYNHSEIEISGVKIPIGLSYKKRFLEELK